jgi:hypothetical protein
LQKDKNNNRVYEKQPNYPKNWIPAFRRRQGYGGQVAGMTPAVG